MNRMANVMCAALVLTLSIASACAAPSNVARDKLLSSGEYARELPGGRKYLLHIPTRYNAAKPAALVLFYHGGGGHMEQGAKAYGWREKSEREGFVVAFPNGSSRWPRGRLATWNAGSCCGYARDNAIDDVGFTRQVIADIQREVNIDATRVFATGMSNGGMMSYRLACEMADVFKAIAAVAGTDNTRACNPARSISVLHIHAQDDTHVLFEGGAGKDAFRDESKITPFTSVPATLQRWQKHNAAQSTPQRIINVEGAVGDLYTSPTNNAQTELLVTTTGGHSWPGSKPVRGKQPSNAISATDAIWEFFARQR